MHEELSKRLKKFKKAEEVAEEYDIDAIVEEKLSQREDEKAFKSLREDLNETKLTQKQKAEIQEEYTDLRKSGLGKTKALMKALKIAGIKLNADTRAKYMKPLKGGKVKADTENVRDLPGKERLKRLIQASESFRGGQLRY
jgi:hypothetical protein